MNIHTLHADHSEQVTRTQDSLRRRVARRFKSPPKEQDTSGTQTNSAPEVWPEVTGRPYLIGAGTLLVMMYMQTRMR
jgi:hypothetical protein